MDKRLSYPLIPKVDLHRHLEGSVRLSTLEETARQLKLDLPSGSDLRALVQTCPGEAHTVQRFLRKFSVLRQFFTRREMIERIVTEAIEDAAAENVRHLELRFTPNALCQGGHFPLEDVMQWVFASAARACRQAGISLCLIASVNRHEPVTIAQAVAEMAVTLGLAGLDLAGDEARFPAAPFLNTFRRAQEDGLAITVHAGEWGSAENVREAIEQFQAGRIGHGIRVLDNPETTRLAVKAGTVFEVCLTSNVQSGAVADISSHPLRKMMQAGLAVTLNSDDPKIFNISLGDEYRLACQRLGLTDQQLFEGILAAARASFLPQARRAHLYEALQRDFLGFLR